MFPRVLVFRKTEIEEAVLAELHTTISGLPSPSKSPIANHAGEVPVVKSISEAKEMLPTLLVFLKIPSILELYFTKAISGLPSPSRSAIHAPVGSPLVLKSTFEVRFILPDELMFLKIDKVLAEPFTATTSAFPSPSISPIAAILGAEPTV